MKFRPPDIPARLLPIAMRPGVATIVVALCLATLQPLLFAAFFDDPNPQCDSLDSPAFVADHIVQARVGKLRPYVAGPLTITRVFLGSLKVGQIIYPKDLFYREKPGTGLGGQSLPLAEGDRVVLFLKGGSFTPTWVNGGLFIIVRGRLCPFGLEAPNGAMGWTPARLASDAPTVKDVAENTANAARWHAMIAAPLGPQSVSSLLRLLKQRSRPFPDYVFDYFPDAVSDAAATRLAELGDLTVADQAISASGSSLYPCRKLFQTPQGRDFLLKQIADPGIAADHRLALASLLAERGAVCTFTEPVAATQPWPPGTAPDRKNSLYLTRISGVAARTAAENERVSGVVLAALRQLTFIGWSSIPRDPEIQSDLDGAADVLREFYHRPSTTDPLRYRIEKVMAGMSYADYLSLHSKCGPILTLAEPLDRTQYAAPAVPSVMLGYEFECAVPYLNGRMPTFPPITATDLVLDPIQGGTNYVLPSGVGAPRNPYSMGGGDDEVPLPAGFKPGRYRLHYRLMEGNTVVSEGHGFETQVPQPELANLPRFTPWTTSGRAFHWRQSWTFTLAALGTLLFFLVVARRIFRSRRRIQWFRSGQCHKCGYDLRASGGRCSECGTLVPSLLRTQILRRRLVRIVAVSFLVLGVTMLGLCARSFLVGDIITRTAYERSDAGYLTRGSAVFQWFTIGSGLGWTYDRQAPSDLPRTASDAGPDADWNIAGLEYASRGNTLVVPLWMPIVFAIAIGVVLRRVRRFTTIARPCTPFP